MSVELEPNELTFQRPFNREVVQKLFIKNTNYDPVAFKVKTTAPKQYCVRPNSGRIEAGKEVEVQVLLQAMKEDPPLDYKCRDKFLVQSVAITADQEFSNVAQIWQHVEKGNKSMIMEKKIRVQYLAPPDAHHPHKSPSPPPYNPSPDTSGKQEDFHDESPMLDSRTRNMESGSKGTDSAESGKSVQDALREANAKIEELTAQLQRPELRQRKVAEVEEVGKKINSGMVTARAQRTEGVPVQLAAALCLVAFLLAYFFF